MKHGFVKLAAAVPEILIAAPTKNTDAICALIDKAYDEGVHVLAFPELSLTGATCGDLFLTESLIQNTLTALETVKKHTAGKKMLTFIGAPIQVHGKLYNCAAAISDGEILGIVPKTNLSADEMRYFRPWHSGETMYQEFAGDMALFKAEHVFIPEEMPGLRVACLIGDDMYSGAADTLAKMGADVMAVMAASPELIGREEYRRTVVTASSGRLSAAYIYANAGMSESTTDSVYGGHCIIASNGEVLAENLPFGGRDLTTAVADVQHLEHDRMKNPGFDITGEGAWRSFCLELRDTDLTGAISSHPFMPDGEEKRKQHCARILEIQAHGLAKRIKAAYAKGCVVALSGGLDSTLALIVTVRAMDILGRDHSEITTVTMPCFGTTSRTRSNAESLAIEFGTAFRCIDIKEAVDLHFRDIGHDPENLSVVYENAQARERTQIIMDIANADGSLVIGTGDLSELALGWATYNGDHMSNYGVNGGVPKTLVRHVVAYYADVCEAEGKTELARVFRDVLATPVSPELLPAKDGEIAQKTEDIVGPYDLHDFFIYHFVRWGETPEKIFREAQAAFAGEFDDETIEKWINIFFRRFYSQQFKRSALPDGPAVGSVAFSPRGAWVMPSDACGWEMKFEK